MNFAYEDAPSGRDIVAGGHPAPAARGMTTLTYAGGLLSKITESAERTLTVTYTGTHITSVADPLGHAYAYSYDTAGNLTTVTAPDGGVTTFA